MRPLHAGGIIPSKKAAYKSWQGDAFLRKAYADWRSAHKGLCYGWRGDYLGRIGCRMTVFSFSGAVLLGSPR